jgi:probable F420-dependent oxidoreductase
MNTGLFALGIGTAVEPAIVRATAAHAERAGFSTLWVGEHVVLFDRQESRYPYSAQGDFPLPADADWLDPFITLTFAAAVTSKIRLATGICLVPEHNPLVLAKEVASLDRLSGGRFALGVGVGWCAEEFTALGIPFVRRAQRTREYVEVMRRLWGEQVTSFHGEFVNFDSARAFPKPARGENLPVLFGGESEPALKRVADMGSGWFGFNLDPAEAHEKVTRLHALLRERKRDPKEVEIVVAPYLKRITADDLKRYRDAGVAELVFVTSPPGEAARVPAWIDQMAADWLEPAARLG